MKINKKFYKKSSHVKLQHTQILCVSMKNKADRWLDFFIFFIITFFHFFVDER